MRSTSRSASATHRSCLRRPRRSGSSRRPRLPRTPRSSRARALRGSVGPSLTVCGTPSRTARRRSFPRRRCRSCCSLRSTLRPCATSQRTPRRRPSSSRTARGLSQTSRGRSATASSRQGLPARPACEQLCRPPRQEDRRGVLDCSLQYLRMCLCVCTQAFLHITPPELFSLLPTGHFMSDGAVRSQPIVPVFCDRPAKPHSLVVCSSKREECCEIVQTAAWSSLPALYVRRKWRPNLAC
mmetsp:Transcript_17992/g.56531  ORF Transcript_17992/g.56531 Transcript_17992/m.56531 type:complete len:240 (+) Transcript_17992:8-727(+)